VSEPVRLRVRFLVADTDPIEDPDADPVDDVDLDPVDVDDEEPFDREDVWATAVDVERDGSGTYRLESSSFFVPLAAGDLVRAAPDADGELQVVDVAEPCDGVLTIFAPDPAASPESVAALMDIWSVLGAGLSERGGPFVATVWPDLPMDAVAAQLNADQEAGRGEWILAAEPHERRREAQDEIDFSIAGS